MPSPLNTPTNERLPNQLWTTIKKNTDISALEFSENQSNDISIADQKTNPLIETMDEESSRCRHSAQSLSSTSAHISESQISDKRKPVKMALNLDLAHNPCEAKARKKPAINFTANHMNECLPQPIDASIPLEKQGWFHGYITRTEAENVLRDCKGGSYLVRRCQSSAHHYSLSLKCIRGFMHIKIVQQNDGTYTFGTSHMTFTSIPQIVSHYGSNCLPIKGAEHMSLLYPVIDQLL